MLRVADAMNGKFTLPIAALLLMSGGAFAADAPPQKAEICATCHGKDGVPINKVTPVIWGQNEGYLYLQLRDFKSGARKNELMAPIVATLEKNDFLALAATGDLASARQALREHAEIAQDAYWVLGRESVVLLGGVLAGVEEDWPTAARLLGAGHQAVRRTPANSVVYYTYRDRAREQLGPARARHVYRRRAHRFGLGAHGTPRGPGHGGRTERVVARLRRPGVLSGRAVAARTRQRIGVYHGPQPRRATPACCHGSRPRSSLRPAGTQASSPRSRDDAATRFAAVFAALYVAHVVTDARGAALAIDPTAG